jgi:hypothetical protein
LIVSLTDFMSSILTCGPFLHQLAHLEWATGREIRVVPPLSRPRYRKISSRGGHLCFIIFSSVLEDGHEISKLRYFFVKSSGELLARPFNYMFFTPLYGVGIQDVPKLAKKITPN